MKKLGLLFFVIFLISCAEKENCKQKSQFQNYDYIKTIELIAPSGVGNFYVNYTLYVYDTTLLNIIKNNTIETIKLYDTLCKSYKIRNSDYIKYEEPNCFIISFPENRFVGYTDKMTTIILQSTSIEIIKNNSKWIFKTTSSSKIQLTFE